jgi:hypothetical protein
MQMNGRNFHQILSQTNNSAGSARNRSGIRVPWNNTGNITHRVRTRHRGAHVRQETLEHEVAAVHRPGWRWRRRPAAHQAAPTGTAQTRAASA